MTTCEQISAINERTGKNLTVEFLGGVYLVRVDGELTGVLTYSLDVMTLVHTVDEMTK